MIFGERLKQIRIERDLSQETLATILGTSKQVISRYETGQRTPKIDVANQYAIKLNVPLEYLLGDASKPVYLPSNAIPYVQGRRFPIVGDIPAGIPIFAEENIQGYEYADVPEGEDYFFLRVKGDSMINAGITSGSLVLIKVQQCADNGQIVACRINGDEATLKRFKQQGEMVILMPENSSYEPIIVSCQDFENGYASVIGVAVKVVRDLL